MRRLTLTNLWAHKRRAVGTALAVVLGVAFLCATLVLGDTLDRTYAAAFERANDAYADGRYEEALDGYDEAIRLNPRDAAAFNNRGNTLKRLGRLEGAIRDYDEAIRLAPDEYATYSNRGDAYARKGDHDRAKEDYRRSDRLKAAAPR